jgi:alkylation response protein AidB-like acyl-CoA dehydrogenase
VEVDSVDEVRARAGPRLTADTGEWGEENIQVHGGIGFTWEHPAHLYFRRAKSAQLMFGGPGFYFEHLLQRSGV